MHRLFTLLAAAAIFTGLAFAETWSGRLVDATCHAQEKGAKPCNATSSTTAFILDVSGTQYQLDAAGNAKAAAALKNRADRAANPEKPANADEQKPAASSAVSAKITGAMEGQSIKVEAVEVQ